jgi:hypothetical protein
MSKEIRRKSKKWGTPEEILPEDTSVQMSRWRSKLKLHLGDIPNWKTDRRRQEKECKPFFFRGQ